MGGYIKFSPVLLTITYPGSVQREKRQKEWEDIKKKIQRKGSRPSV